MKGKKVTGLLLGLLFIFVATITSPCFAKDLVLTVGQQQTMKAPGLSRIAIGDQKVADVKALAEDETVLITAKGVGKTNLIIWGKDDTQTFVKIEVIEIDPDEMAAEIRALLADVEGIRVRTMGRKVVIDGYALKVKDLKKIEKIAGLYPDAISLATLSPAVIDTIVGYINREFDQYFGKDTVHARKMANAIALEGEVRNEEQKSQAETIAKSYHDSIVNFIKVGVEMQDLLNISVDFVEMVNDDETDVGFDWTQTLSLEGSMDGESSFDFGKGSIGALTGTFGLVADYSTTLSLIKSNSKSHILAQPKLLCRSGEKAEFLAGGEVAIPIVSGDTTDVEYKDYGMSLKISPTVDTSGNIASSIEIENSSISGYASDGSPSFRTSRVSTFVNCKDQQTIVLSGIVTQEQLKDVDKVPGLGDIPILGELFKSREFQDNHSELLIFITPTIVSGKMQEMADESKAMKERFNKAGNTMHFNILD